MLIKTSNNITDYVLPVKILTKKGYVRRLRYYDDEKTLWKAYRQLVSIKSDIIKPLYPVVYNCENKL